ncbi:MAG: hypothetical protein LW636_12150 [Planctomycetaceae bacterium]|nr:hypothetical protein [Planctomycetaceae bacterium]
MTHLPHHPPRRRRAPRGFALMDAVIAGVLLSIGMVAVLSVGAQAMTMQRRGEVDVRAAAALDELLAGILTEGPVDYPEIHPMAGAFEFGSPYEDFQYSIEIEPSGPGVPALVRATLVHESGREYAIETMIAEKRGDEPDPIRTPLEPIDREARLAELEEARNAQQPQQ